MTDQRTTITNDNESDTHQHLGIAYIKKAEGEGARLWLVGSLSVSLLQNILSLLFTLTRSCLLLLRDEVDDISRETDTSFCISHHSSPPHTQTHTPPARASTGDDTIKLAAAAVIY